MCDIYFELLKHFCPITAKSPSDRFFFLTPRHKKETKINECCVQCNGLLLFVVKTRHVVVVAPSQVTLKISFFSFHNIFNFRICTGFELLLLFNNKKERGENNIVVNAVKEKAIECDSLRSNTVISIRQT